MAALQDVMETTHERPPAVPKPGASTKITCDQVIFTSVRTPTGEGYRIIAASRGLSAEEKRAITQNAPSHNGLYDQSDNAHAVAFYPLPSGRLCAACSCSAGSEHSGRGGNRVYTYAAILEAESFPAIRFNPFHLFRAIEAGDHGKPRLEPPEDLETLELDVPIGGIASKSPQSAGAVEVLGSPAHRQRALHCLTSGVSLAVALKKDAPSCAEALILAVPGPMRAALSFSEGIRFSVGRCYMLNLIHGDTVAARNRAAGHSVEFLDPAKPPHDDDEPASDWFRFVDGHWKAGTLDQLDLRTSTASEDATCERLEHDAEVYLAIDGVDQYDFYELLSVAGECLKHAPRDVPDSPQAELLERIKPLLIRKWDTLQGSDIEAYWTRSVRLWRESDEAVMYMQPVLDHGLDVACKEDPWVAARRVLEISRDFPLSAWKAGLRQTIQRVLECWADDWQGDDNRPHTDTAGGLLLNQWRMVRPKCAVVARLTEYVSPPAEPEPTPSRRVSDPNGPPHHNRRATDPNPSPD